VICLLFVISVCFSEEEQKKCTQKQASSLTKRPSQTGGYELCAALLDRNFVGKSKDRSKLLQLFGFVVRKFASTTF
jgi:hypothetical protein